MNQDTIVAITTAPGAGAIGVIRLSGPAAVKVANKIFKGKDLSRQASHTLHFGKIVAPPAAAQPNNNTPPPVNESELIDEVVAALFLAPKSYTGEDIVEISAHGSPYILNRVLNLCISHGARLAGPGEFTQRAFLDGKMDLVQAEAVADLIASENKAAHDLAMSQMRGGVSSELAKLREQLVNFTALIELELDFSDEDVEFADRTALKDLISNLKSQISNLIESFEYGNAIKNGVTVAIIGKPNAGKSTLLNALLKEERAIVSDVAGTTRDVIEEAITLDGVTFRFIDTAGIRDTEDAIEAIGVQRAKEKVKQAKVVIHLYEDDHRLLDELAENLQDKIVFNLLSKYDVNKKEDNSFISNISNLISFPISVKTGMNMDKLSNELVSYFKNNQGQSSVIITNARHKEALGKALAALEEVENGMQMNLSGDLLSLHLKDALYHIGTITGKIEVDKDILGTIFGKFCIGK